MRSANSLPPTADWALRVIFEEIGQPEDASTPALRRPASSLIRRLEGDLLANVYRWTGHFPERTRQLLRHLAQRAEQLQQVYPEDRETHAAVALTTLISLMPLVAVPAELVATH